MKKAFSLFLSIVLCIFVSSCTNSKVFEELDALVTVEGYMEISIDEKNWKQTLDKEDFDLYLVKKYPVFDLIPVTTETGKPPFYIVDQEKKEIVETSYIEIPLYFRSSTLNQVIWKSATLSSLPISWMSDVDFQSSASQVEMDDEMFASLVNSIRLSIEDVNQEGSMIVYERESGYHHNHVISEGGNLSSDGQGMDGYLSYYYAKHHELLFGADNVLLPGSLTDIKESKNIQVLSLIKVGQFYEGHMIIRIWVEQWDPDFYPVILEGDFAMQLTFLGKKSD
jgi:hypothetical protein